jgi:hypothetical protein
VKEEPLRALAVLLPSLLPAAISWAERESDRGLREGAPLAGDRQDLAARAGVVRPERVRVLLVEALPQPEEPAIREAGKQAGLLAPGMIGLTLGYAIFIRRGSDSRRTISHELRHVRQYEAAGGIAAFLPVYLLQILELGYEAAPMEADARAHETD